RQKRRKRRKRRKRPRYESLQRGDRLSDRRAEIARLCAGSVPGPRRTELPSAPTRPNHTNLAGPTERHPTRHHSPLPLLFRTFAIFRPLARGLSALRASVPPRSRNHGSRSRIATAAADPWVCVSDRWILSGPCVSAAAAARPDSVTDGLPVSARQTWISRQPTPRQSGRACSAL